MRTAETEKKQEGISFLLIDMDTPGITVKPIITLAGSFSGQSPETIEGMFGALIGDGPRQILWHFVFVALCLGIVIGGVQKGIERWSKISYNFV